MRGTMHSNLLRNRLARVLQRVIHELDLSTSFSLSLTPARALTVSRSSGSIPLCCSICIARYVHAMELEIQFEINQSVGRLLSQMQAATAIFDAFFSLTNIQKKNVERDKSVVRSF